MFGDGLSIRPNLGITRNRFEAEHSALAVPIRRETPSILAGTGIITGLGQNGFAGTGTGAVKASAVKQNIAQRASE